MSKSPRAVLYVRLSRESKVSTSIAGQNADLYAAAEREGWQIVATFEDNGKSGGKQRENAEAALDMLRNNEADVLAVYAYDRWSRMGIADSADVIKVIKDRQARARRGRTLAPLFYSAREGIRSDQEGWEIRVAFAADIAEKERDRMVARRTAAIERMRREGRNPGTGPAPYGYRSAPFDDGRPGKRFVIDHEEAQIIREVADRLVAGESCTSLAFELTRRRVPMPRSAHRLALLKNAPTVNPETGKELPTGNWTSSRVSQIWVSDHLLGRIMHKTERAGRDESEESRTDEERPPTAEERRLARSGEPVLDPATGMPLQAFDPILDIETMHAIRKRFAGNPGRGRQQKRRAARLLSGLAFCGHCDSPAYVVSSQGYAYYRCASKSRGITCDGLKISAPILERLVTERFLASFGRLPAVEFIERRGAPEVDDAIATLTEQISLIGRKFADDDADVPALVQQREDLLGKRAALRHVKPTSTIERVDLGQTWGELFTATEDVAKQRGYIAAAYAHVEVFRRTDAERVRYFPNPSPEEYAASEEAGTP
jgi:site-specific DNA recombinase